MKHQEPNSPFNRASQIRKSNLRLPTLKPETHLPNLVHCQSMTLRSKTIQSKHLPQLDTLPDIKIMQNVPKNPLLIAAQQTQMKRSSIQSVQSFVTESNQSEEEHEVWDNNQDLRVKKLTLEENKPGVGTFLSLYKARYGGYPGNQQNIKNEDVIKVAVQYAATNKKLYRKYFPQKQVIFDDEQDYSTPYQVQEDSHFKNFSQFYWKQKSLSKVSSKSTLPPMDL